MFLTPANPKYCPDVYDQTVLLIDEELFDSDIEWNLEETEMTEPWNCKYHIQTAMSLDPYGSKGYVMV